jgi:hypothetical protein
MEKKLQILLSQLRKITFRHDKPEIESDTSRDWHRTSMSKDELAMGALEL